jgi:hypothetical protein
MKKIALLLVLVLALSSFTGIAYAKENGVKKADKILEKRGFPEELINMMPYEQKEDIIEQKAYYEGHKKVSMDEIDDDSLDGVSIKTISTSDLDFYITTTYLYPFNSDEKKLRIYTNYEWLIQPFFTFSDPVGIAWDSGDWRVLPGDYTYKTYYDCMNIDTFETSTHSYSDDAVSYSDPNGVGWDMDIKNSYNGLSVTKNYGYGAVTIEARTPSESGTCELYAKYAHAQGTGSIGLSYGIASIDVTGGADYDSRGTEKFVNY